MEKFNLERALAGDPVITRNGKEVTQLAKFNIQRDKQCLIGVLNHELERWTVDGNYFLSETESEQDLFMKPKENAIWINVYKKKDGFLYTTGVDYINEESAKASIDKIGYLKTIKIVE
jgi:hypothetical protein